MNRLTQKELSSNGQVHCTGGTSPDCNDSCINTTCEWQKKADRKLWEYENAEENGVTDYNKGMNDAWELARKIVLLGLNDFREIFGDIWSSAVFRDYTPQEIKSKIEAWEKAKTEIKVGDVVEVIGCEEKAIVVSKIPYSSVSLLFENGKTGGTLIENCTKTGRTIDIQSVLEQIGETV